MKYEIRMFNKDGICVDTQKHLDGRAAMLDALRDYLTIGDDETAVWAVQQIQCPSFLGFSVGERVVTIGNQFGSQIVILRETKTNSKWSPIPLAIRATQTALKDVRQMMTDDLALYNMCAGIYEWDASWRNSTISPFQWMVGKIHRFSDQCADPELYASMKKWSGYEDFLGAIRDMVETVDKTYTHPAEPKTWTPEPPADVETDTSCDLTHEPKMIGGAKLILEYLGLEGGSHKLNYRDIFDLLCDAHPEYWTRTEARDLAYRMEKLGLLVYEWGLGFVIPSVQQTPTEEALAQLAS